MATLTDVAQQVRDYWLAAGLDVRPVAMSEVMDACRALPGALPKALRATADVLRDAGAGCNATEASVIIVDSFQESWWYTLWVSGPWKGFVSLVLGTKTGNAPQFPLGTLEEFLLAYIHDNEERLCARSRGVAEPC
ncbi:hypothetical protein [Myxococcus landrumensis]|uniref:Uncharacterized protein n=1 Tax=Myxococcus landrumensis TaxID=2813577 RepID=A0ABX7N5N8_9BACT|nr:hypothetical protein [Myxococcus landrumus]QSQ12985.1 hypothetical protein JY572_32255 [Myxococcus landrumus]